MLKHTNYITSPSETQCLQTLRSVSDHRLIKVDNRLCTGKPKIMHTLINSKLKIFSLHMS